MLRFNQEIDMHCDSLFMTFYDHLLRNFQNLIS